MLTNGIPIKVLKIYNREGDRGPDKFGFLFKAFSGSDQHVIKFLEYLVSLDLLTHNYTPANNTADFVITDYGKSFVKTFDTVMVLDKQFNLSLK